MNALDLSFLQRLTEAPGVGTACGPVLSELCAWMGPGFERTMVQDGFCLFHAAGAGPHRIRSLLVAHVDEIGGCALGPDGSGRPGRFRARAWGNHPWVYCDTPLQAMDWLAEDGSARYPVALEIDGPDEAPELTLVGERIRPYRTVFTFDQKTRIEGDRIEGKALDPRVTAYCVAHAVRSLHDPRIAALFVLAEECAMDIARKAVTFLASRCPDLCQIVNADVPELGNLADSRIDMPAIRIFEGRNFVDPGHGIRLSETLEKEGVAHQLSAARTGSQTPLFSPLAPTVSVALPSDGIHCQRYRMSLQGVDRCVTLLCRLATVPI